MIRWQFNEAVTSNYKKVKGPDCFLKMMGLGDFLTLLFSSISLELEFSGREIRSAVVFNPAEDTSLAHEEDEGSELKGPVIDRRCSRCNKEGMIYHTRQMRSADEGQTVFFTCVHCRFQEKEDS
ncbi:DNA-directed RNA polymerase I subunit RPA12 [Nematolebias whitei]|uniref:DNA-directed RNA polymerase I subunit RPA12 n=1 Tax=Nematolebias whitei TaxID=451745 RepID=UPI001896BE0D|nr:DNA-directed RNA polymerase I subunit RPA12 [Nematolebias whitei]